MPRPLMRPSLWSYALAHRLQAVFCIALIVRLANLATLRGRDAFFAEADTIIYWRLGTALATPGEFSATLLSMTERMPLYPLFLAGVQSVFGDAPRAVALIQASIDAGTCVLIAALGGLLTPIIGLIAGLLAALSINLIVYSSQILTDTLFLFFTSAMLLAGALFLRTPSNQLAVVAGLAGGLGLLTRPLLALLLLAAVPVVFAVGIVHRRALAPSLIATLLFAAAAFLPATPVLIRNVVHYGAWSLSTQTGAHLAYWIVPLVTQRANGTPYQITVDQMKALVTQRMAARGLGAGSNPFAVAAIKSELAREQLARLPVSAFVRSWLEGMVVNLGAPALLLDPRARALPKPSFYNTPGRTLWEKVQAYLFDDPGLYQVLLLVGLAGTLPFVLLSAFGLALLRRMQLWGAMFALGTAFYFLMINGPVAAPKYRLPIEPLLIVCSAIPLAWIVGRRSDFAPSPPASLG